VAEIINHKVFLMEMTKTGKVNAKIYVYNVMLIVIRFIKV